MFLLENVPNLLLMHKGHFRDAILDHFISIGYANTTYLKVSAADFGVPQSRERVFFSVRATIWICRLNSAPTLRLFWTV